MVIFLIIVGLIAVGSAAAWVFYVYLPGRFRRFYDELKTNEYALIDPGEEGLVSSLQHFLKDITQDNPFAVHYALSKKHDGAVRYIADVMLSGIQDDEEGTPYTVVVDPTPVRIKGDFYICKQTVAAKKKLKGALAASGSFPEFTAGVREEFLRLFHVSVRQAPEIILPFAVQDQLLKCYSYFPLGMDPEVITFLRINAEGWMLVSRRIQDLADLRGLVQTLDQIAVLVGDLNYRDTSWKELFDYRG
jgi:hypothetical protein